MPRHVKDLQDSWQKVEKKQKKGYQMLHDVDEEAEPEAEPEAEAAQPEAAQPEAARPGEAKSEEAQSDEDVFRWCIEACSELEGVDVKRVLELLFNE